MTFLKKSEKPKTPKNPLNGTAPKFSLVWTSPEVQVYLAYYIS